MISIHSATTRTAFLLTGIMIITAPALGQEYAAEVYQDADMAIHASVPELTSSAIHFGDLLSLVVDVAYNSGRVSVEPLDDGFFRDVWPEGDGPVLLDWQSSRNSHSGRYTDELHSVFRFQILDCPGEELTCAGDREYQFPEFNLTYRVVDVDEAADTTKTLRFRPWPSRLIVSSAIPLDEEDQLHPFQTYFPTGAYPDPLSGSDRTGKSLGIAGVGMAVMLGGVLMWPFGSKQGRRFATKSSSRWRKLFQELQDDDEVDGTRFLDSVRRCLVWYCTDELDIDPFDWLHRSEYESEKQADESLMSLRSLFIDLLHNPVGQGPELRTRLSDLIGHDAQR